MHRWQCGEIRLGHRRTLDRMREGISKIIFHIHGYVVESQRRKEKGGNV